MPKDMYPVSETDLEPVPTDPARHVHRFRSRRLWKRHPVEDLAREADAARDAASDLREAQLHNPPVRY